MAKERKAFPAEVSEEEREEILLYLYERFGLPPELFNPYIILKGVKNYWLLRRNPHLDKLKKLSPEVVGLLFLRKISQFLKPTSSFLQRFGLHATKNVITLEEEDLRILIEKKVLHKELPLESGYVILKDKNWILGCGLYLPGKLYSYLDVKLRQTITLD